MSETTTEKYLQAILKLPVGEVAKYSSNHLYQLWHQVNQELQTAKKAKQWLEAAVALKYQEHFRSKRSRLEKETGMVHLEDSGVKISCNIAKKIAWDQEKLVDIKQAFEVNGADSKQYIKISYNVPEKHFANWPADIQKIFKPARISSTYSPAYELSKIEDGGE
ncbi:MAG: hypothetical protein DGJ47_000344 [Rickettsiaceae bacterium]